MTIQRRTVHLLATGVLLLVVAYALPEPSVPPVGDEATVLGATASFWHDRDLRFDRPDMVRVERAWRGHVQGLALIHRTEVNGPFDVFATPWLYPVVAAPAYGLLGARGLRVLNAALFLLVFWTAWSLLGHPHGCRRLPRSGLALSAFFFASVALAHVLALTATAFEMACVFFALALWCRVRERPLWGRREVLPLAVAGALLACAFAVEPPLGLFVLPPAADLVWSKRWKAAAAFALAAVLCGALLVHAQRDAAGSIEWTWGWGLHDAAQTYDGALPFEVGAPPVATVPGPPAAETHGAAAVLRNLWDLLVGRHVGLLPYFPFAVFALGLYLVDLRRPGKRTRHLVALALLAYLVAVASRLSEVAATPAAPSLAALAAVYPLFLFLPWRLRAGTAVLLPFAAAGLWTVPALVTSLRPPVPEAVLELHARGPTYRPLPLEVSLLAAGRLPGYVSFDRPAAAGLGTWLVPREAVFSLEPNPQGVWMRGASRAEIYVVAPGHDLPEIRMTVHSISADNVFTIEGKGPRVIVRFDSEAKRLGTPIAIRPQPVARMDVDGDGKPDAIGRFVVESSDGTVPARVNPASRDERFLGTFLAFGPPPP